MKIVFAHVTTALTLRLCSMSHEKVVRSLKQQLRIWEFVPVETARGKDILVIWEWLVLLLWRVWTCGFQPNILTWQDRMQELWDGLVSCKGQAVRNELLCGNRKQKISQSLGGETWKNYSAFSLKMGQLSYLPRSPFRSLLGNALTLLTSGTERVPSLLNSSALVTLCI